eukprot:235301_1
MSCDDLPPPLEDCSDLLESRKNTRNPYVVKNDSSKRNKSEMNLKKKATNSMSLNAGFLLNKQKQKTKKSENRSKKKRRKKLEMKSKQNHLIIPEAQQKLNETHEAKMGKMTEKLHQNKDVWNAMLSPEFGQAMNELALNPQEALKKYQNDPSILPTLSKIVQTMYGKSLPSISKDIHTEIQKQNNT